MRILLGLVCGLVMLNSQIVCAQVKFQGQVDRLVKKLETDDGVANRAAVNALVKLGVESLDALEVALAKAKPDAQQKIHAVRQQIEQLDAEKRVQASQVSLDGEMSLDEVLDSLEKQSKTSFSVEQDGEGQLELSLTKVSFWEAMDEILDQAKLQVSPYGGESGQLNLVPRPEDFEDYVGRTAYSGAFRVAITRIETSRDYNDPTEDSTNLKLEIVWESHVKPLAIEQSLNDVTAIDEFKDKLPVKLPEGGEEAVLSESVHADIPMTEMYLPFELIDRKVEHIDTLEGTMQVLLPGRVETFDFGKIAELKLRQEIRRSRAVVSFLGAQKNDDLYAVSVGLKFDEQANPLSLHRAWVMDNQIYLVDDQGKQHKPIGSEQVMMAENQMGITYLFEMDPQQYRLIYRSPAQLIKIPVKYKLKDIILP